VGPACLSGFEGIMVARLAGNISDEATTRRGNIFNGAMRHLVCVGLFVQSFCVYSVLNVTDVTDVLGKDC
jgi:hypothetical protein